MKKTLNIDEELLAKAQILTGIADRTAVLHAGLKLLIARESGRRLAALGSSQPALRAPRRRRGH